MTPGRVPTWPPRASRTVIVTTGLSKPAILQRQWTGAFDAPPASMRIAAFIVSCALWVSACSATSTSVSARRDVISPGPASWQGPLADRTNQQANGPATPALKSLQGQAPLVYLARVPARGVADEPTYELAAFDDGTLVYEGHRCVKVGGIVLTHLGADDVTRLKDLLATLCTGLDTTSGDELCDDAATVRISCSNGQQIQSGSDHCRKTNEAQSQHVDALVSALGQQLDLASWLGEPTRRQACTPGARDLSPHELVRTVRPGLADAGPLGR